MKNLKTFDEFLNESYSDDTIYYHGSTDKNLSGKKGIHIGTKLAATQALNARIGVPVIGEWDGKREYSNTLLAGKNTLKKKEIELGYYCSTGFNCSRDVPEHDYYVTDRNERSKYSDGTLIPFNSKPIIFKVKITGKMTNSPRNPHKDNKANSLMLRSLKNGNAKSGYYYINDGEDSGSISAVVPNSTFLKIL